MVKFETGDLEGNPHRPGLFRYHCDFCFGFFSQPVVDRVRDHLKPKSLGEYGQHMKKGHGVWTARHGDQHPHASLDEPLLKDFSLHKADQRWWMTLPFVLPFALRLVLVLALCCAHSFAVLLLVLFSVQESSNSLQKVTCLAVSRSMSLWDSFG